MTSLTIIGIYLVILLLLGVSSNRLFRGTSLDYMLASHSIGPFLLLMSLFGTTMTGFSMVGSSSASYRVGIGIYGLLASSSAILHPLCFFLIGMKLWSLGHRYGYSTQIEFFQDRLQSPRIGWALFPVVVGLVVPYVLVGIISAGAVFNGASLGLFETAFADYGHGIPPWLGSLVVCLVVLTYVFLGGMRGTAWANAFQTCVFMALGVITFFVLVKGIGGQESFLDSLKSASSAVDPAKLSREKMPHREYFAFLLIPFSIGMFPHIFQHWLTARNAAAFKLPIVAHPVFVMIVWAPCVLIGTWTSADGVLPAGVNPNSLLSYLVSAHSGEVLAGLLTAGILAAIMSSLDSQFLCLGTMFTKDILQRKSGTEEEDRRTVLLARSFVVAVVAVCYLLSLVVPGGVFNLGVWCFTGFSALFPLVAAALYWRGLTAAGVYAGILTTGVLWCYEFWQSGYGVDKHYEFLGIHPVVSIVAGSTIAMIAVSLVTKRPNAQTLAKFFPDNHAN
jgi:SSS family solute:Na+ symporter